MRDCSASTNTLHTYKSSLALGIGGSCIPEITMGQTEYRLINSFVTGAPSSGSQVAVVFLNRQDERLQNEVWMQAIAHNFNYPATSFLVPVNEEGAELEYNLRWFAEGVSCHLSEGVSTLLKDVGTTLLRSWNSRSFICNLRQVSRSGIDSIQC